MSVLVSSWPVSRIRMLTTDNIIQSSAVNRSGKSPWTSAYTLLCGVHLMLRRTCCGWSSRNLLSRKTCPRKNGHEILLSTRWRLVGCFVYQRNTDLLLDTFMQPGRTSLKQDFREFADALLASPNLKLRTWCTFVFPRTRSRSPTKSLGSTVNAHRDIPQKPELPLYAARPVTGLRGLAPTDFNLLRVNVRHGRLASPGCLAHQHWWSPLNYYHPSFCG